MYRVLLMRHQHLFLDGGSVEIVLPYREPVLEPELVEVLGTRQVENASGALATPNRIAGTIREPEPLREMVQHDDAA
jgi:hypothetical protein